MLRMAFGHAQLLLYRPFLHYVAQNNNDKPVDQRAFACASACVSVSRNIIHISTEMRKKGVLAGAYWFSMYTTFFAIVSILYFVLENSTSPTSFELLRDAVEGKEVLAYFSTRSMAADRCSMALKVSIRQKNIFQNSNITTEHVRKTPRVHQARGRDHRVEETPPRQFPAVFGSTTRPLQGRFHGTSACEHVSREHPRCQAHCILEFPTYFAIPPCKSGPRSFIWLSGGFRFGFL